MDSFSFESNYHVVMRNHFNLLYSYRMKTDNLLRWLGLPILGAVLGSVITIMLQQYFFKPNKEVELGMTLRKELVKEQYSLYNKLKFWTELNSYTTFDMFLDDTIRIPKKNADGIWEDVEVIQGPGTHTGCNCEYLALVFDSSLIKKSNEIAEELYANQFNIDGNIFSNFDYLARYKKDNPFPSYPTLSQLQKNGWAQSRSLNEWVNANRKLGKKVSAFMGM